MVVEGMDVSEMLFGMFVLKIVVGINAPIVADEVPNMVVVGINLSKIEVLGIVVLVMVGMDM